MKIYTCESFNSFISTQDNLTLRAIRENLATIMMIKLFFAPKHSLERILDQDFATTRVFAQETHETKSKRAKIAIR
jgi:hypothetical protein